MKPVTGKEFAEVIKRFGWEYKRTTDSHNNKQLKTDLQAHQIKIAGITEKDL